MLWFLNFFFQDIVDTEFGAKPGCECVGRWLREHWDYLHG